MSKSSSLKGFEETLEFIAKLKEQDSRERTDTLARIAIMLTADMTQPIYLLRRKDYAECMNEYKERGLLLHASPCSWHKIQTISVEDPLRQFREGCEELLHFYDDCFEVWLLPSGRFLLYKSISGGRVTVPLGEQRGVSISRVMRKGETKEAESPPQELFSNIDELVFRVRHSLIPFFLGRIQSISRDELAPFLHLLKHLLGDKDIAIRSAAMDAVERSAVEFSSTLGPAATSDLVQLLLLGNRMNAIVKIGKGAFEPLLLALKNGESRAANLLTRIDKEKAGAVLPQIILDLVRDRKIGGANAVTKVLGNIRGNLVVEPLIQAMVETDNASAKAAIIEVLGKTGDERTVDLVRPSADLAHYSPTTRKACDERTVGLILPEISKVLSQKELFSDLRSVTPGRAMLTSVVNTLTGIDDERAFIPLTQAESVIILSREPFLMHLINEAILRIENKLTAKSTEPLIAAIESGEVPFWRAIPALGRIGDKHSIQYLTHLHKKSKDRPMREAAGKQLDKLHSP